MSEKDNERLMAETILEEVGLAVFSLNGSSSCGLDVFLGLFYQQCWDIVGEDVLQLVRSFW